MEGVTAEVRSGVRRRRRRLLLAVPVLAIAILGLTAAKAFADSGYRVVECHPGAHVYSAPDLHVSGHYGVGLQYGKTCTIPDPASWGKGIVFHPSEYSSSPRNGTAELRAPVGTYFNSGGFRWDIGARYSCSDGNCYYAAAYVGHGRTPHNSYPMGASPNAGYSVWTSCGTSCTRIWEDISCSSFCVHSTSPNDWYYDYVAIRDIDVTLVDSSAPTLRISGSLFASQIAHGTPALDIDSADVGGGVRRVTVEVNGVPVATPDTSCPGIPPGAAWATRFRPCGNLSTALHLDTEKTPWRDGQNSVRVCASDVATGPGEPNTVCKQRTVSVDNSCPDSSGASGQARSINVGLEDPKSGQLKRTRTARSSQGTALRGRLSGSAGSPVKAASVCVYETVDEPAGIEQLVQVAKSSSSGNFGVEIPGGPSRSFRVAYRYTDHQLESPSMYLDSSVLPTFKVTKSRLRNRHSVGFRGRIPGPNADGRAVTMQAKVGEKWRSFKQLQTDPSGRFRGKYRFTQTRGRVRYVFRAVVKKQGGYPYSRGASRKRKVIVRG